MDLQDLFVKGEYFPLTGHADRINKYVRNEMLIKGEHANVFDVQSKTYVSVNWAGLITRKGSDFLFGESPIISSGTEANSKEQMALDRITADNKLTRLNYQQSLKASGLGECFYKIRYGQEYGGAFPISYDPKRVLIEAVDPKKVYPQTHPFDKSKIVAYHVAEPILVDTKKDKYQLFVESHFSGKIVYRQFELVKFQVDKYGNIITFKIGEEIPAGYEEQLTGVAVPLVVHIPNTNDGTDWEGQDDISEHMSLFDECNNRISQLSMILDKHADPALAVPAGLLQEDGEGNVYFNVAANKVFEVLGKEDIIPQYVVNSSPLVTEAFKELELIVDYLLATTEIPGVAVGLKDAGGGTSGNSGLSIKWKMAGLLAKINRKKQFFEDGLVKVYMIAQMLEAYANPKIVDYEITVPKIQWQEGLPIDDTDVASRMAIRTNGGQTISRKTALMIMDNLTEEQAQAELDRIEEEREAAMSAEVDLFNQTQMVVNENKEEESPAEANKDNKQKQDKEGAK